MLLLAEKGDKAAKKIVQKRQKAKGVSDGELIMIESRLAKAGDAAA